MHKIAIYANDVGVKVFKADAPVKNAVLFLMIPKSQQYNYGIQIKMNNAGWRVRVLSASTLLI